MNLQYLIQGLCSSHRNVYVSYLGSADNVKDVIKTIVCPLCGRNLKEVTSTLIDKLPFGMNRMNSTVRLCGNDVIGLSLTEINISLHSLLRSGFIGKINFLGDQESSGNENRDLLASIHILPKCAYHIKYFKQRGMIKE